VPAILARCGRPAAPPALLLTILLTIAGCASGSTGTPGRVTVTDAWVRAAAVAGQTTAAYFTIANGTTTNDALLGVSTPAAGIAQIHETTMSSGMMGMRDVPRVNIPAGGTVQFAPGGYHVMLMSLTAPLAAGATVELTLVFEHAGTVVVKAEVRKG
jgi:hypothetical protein